MSDETRLDRRHAARAAAEVTTVAVEPKALDATIHPDFPYRHATRLLNAFHFRVGQLGLEAFDRNIEASLLFYMIHRAAMHAPDERRISINGIATSLSQSTETMRRAARVLVDHWLSIPSRAACSVHPDISITPSWHGSTPGSQANLAPCCPRSRTAACHCPPGSGREAAGR